MYSYPLPGLDPPKAHFQTIILQEACLVGSKCGNMEKADSGGKETKKSVCIIKQIVGAPGAYSH